MRRLLMPTVVLLWTLSALLSTSASADAPAGSGPVPHESQAGLVGLPKALAATPANLAFAVTECAKQLQAGNGARNDLFGFHVALSADGRVALIGAPGARGDRGAAYLFVRHGPSWIQEQEIAAADGVPGDEFGFSVALSADGRVALVGAYGKNEHAGAAYVFEGHGSNYPQKNELQAANGAPGDYFGEFVALSANGQVVLIGANGKNNFRGAAYVFHGHDSNYAQLQELQAADGADGGGFGLVALSADGRVVLIGSQDAAYLFQRQASSYVQKQKLQASDGTPEDDFGNMVALSANGKVALVGAPFKNNRQGAAYVFRSQGSSYSQVQKLQAADGAPGDLFGFLGGALSADGHVALISAPLKSSSKGAAYLFQGYGSHYVQKKKLQASNGAPGDEFGFSAALSANGQVALIGAPYKKSAQGAAFVF